MGSVQVTVWLSKAAEGICIERYTSGRKMVWIQQDCDLCRRGAGQWFSILAHPCKSVAGLFME